ncbi:MAG: S-layer homology domain-containing protein [Oscillospiraceae bacterium]|nr:S-layer homology domain-containing protein [Oscillospiraceae bacterium]
MNKWSKKTISILLAICMVFSVLTVGALAVEDEMQLQSLPFTDVTAGDWFYNAVRHVYPDIMRGTGATHFSPHSSLNRAMVATILHRIADEPPVPFRPIFNDVGPGEWYSVPITWGYDEQVMFGMGGGRFAPGDQITGEQLATMMHRYAGNNGLNTTVPATVTAPAGTSDWAVEAVRWALYNEFFRAGMNLQTHASRAETAYFVYQFSGLETESAPPVSFRLSAGQYIVGVDIPAGVYNVTAVSGAGNLQGEVHSLGFLGLNEILAAPGTPALVGTQTFRNLRLTNGDVFRVMGNLVAEFAIRTPSMPQPGTNFSLSVGQFVVGVDIPAGTYNVVAVSGSGNFIGTVQSLGFMGLNEILTAPDSPLDIGTPTFSNLRLTDGDVIRLMWNLVAEFSVA